MLTTIEKVILLQEIDVFRETPTEELAFIASIAEEVSYPRDSKIFREGEMSDSSYVVLEGSVKLERDGQEVMTAKKKDSFGNWALFDNAPRLVTATAQEETTLLRIDREDFFDLLSDNISITESLFKALVKRVKDLM